MSEMKQTVVSALDHLNPVDLREIAESAQRLIVEKAASIWTDAKAKIDEVAAGLGVSPQEMVERVYPRVKSAAKYADPSNSKRTWTGRGHQPKWLKEAISGGKKLDDFLVDKPKGGELDSPPESIG